MKSPREIELKLEVPEQALGRLSRSPLLRTIQKETRRPVSLVSVYYDTETQKLRRHGLTLRVRRIGRRYVQTIKREGGASSVLMDRGEWEHDIVGGRLNLDLIEDAGLRRIFDEKLQAQLKPLFEIRVRRKVYCLRSGGSEIELAIDKGIVAAGGESSPICELELELKHGDAAELFKVARSLAEQVPVQLEVTSKSERGYALIDGRRTGAVGAVPIAISPDASSRAAFQTIARACLHQIVANQTPLRNGDLESLHQIRVGLRRLRAAISLLGDMLLDPQSGTIKLELKWIARELGTARELDVFSSRVAKSATASELQQPAVATLVGDLRRRLRDALRDVRSAIESHRFQALLLDTAAWIEIGDWTGNADDLARALRDQPIAILAATELEQLHTKIVKRGAELAELDPVRRHKMRVQAKKLRYGCEFFAGAFPGKAAARRRKELLAALGRLQDMLGDLNDIAVNQGLAAQLAGTRRSGSRGATDKAFAAGRLVGREEARIGPVLEDAERAFARFAKARPFWL